MQRQRSSSRLLVPKSSSTALSDSIAADELVDKISADSAVAIKANVADVGGIERLMQDAVAWGGQIDILIPKAGISLMGTLEQTEEADFERSLLPGSGTSTLPQHAFSDHPHTCPQAPISFFYLHLFATGQV